MPGLPLKRWGKVVTSPKLSASAVRIEPAGEGSYLLLFREAHGEFDEWFETMADLERMLEGSSIDWEADSGPER